MLPPLFSDDLDQNPLAAAAVELSVKDLFPRAKVKPAAGDGRHLPPHNLAFQMRVRVVLPEC